MEAEPVGDEVEEKRVAGLGLERKPVAVAAGMEAAGERGGEGDGLGRSRSVVRLGFDHRGRGRQERRGEGLCGAGNVAEEIDQIGRGIAGREQPPGVTGHGAAGGIAGTDVDRDLLEPRRPLLGGKGREGRRSAAGEPHAVDVDLHRLGQPGDRREDKVDLRRRRHAEPVVVVVAAGGVEVVDPHHVAPLGGGGEVEERIVGVVAAGGGEDAAAGIENVEDRGHPRVDPPGPDLGADPLTGFEGNGVMVRLARRGPRGDRRVGGHLLRFERAVWLAGLHHLGTGADEERARAARAVAADGDNVIEAGRHVGGDRHDHPPRDGARLRVELGRCGHLRRRSDAGVGKDELLEVVEVDAEERDGDLRALLATGWLEVEKCRAGEVGGGRGRGEQASDRQNDRGEEAVESHDGAFRGRGRRSTAGRPWLRCRSAIWIGGRLPPIGPTQGSNGPLVNGISG